MEQMLYEAGAINRKFIPVLLEGAEPEDRPLPLRPFTYYRLPVDQDALLRKLHGRPEVLPVPVGAVPEFVSRTGLEGAGVPGREPLRDRLRRLLGSIHPEVLRLVDAGQSEIRVMIAVPNEIRLHQLMTEEGFGGLLRVSGTGASIVASRGSRIGGHLHDLLDGMNMNGYLLEPSSDLLRGI